MTIGVAYKNLVIDGTKMDGRLDRWHGERTRQSRMLDKARLPRYYLVNMDHDTVDFKHLLGISSNKHVKRSLMYECTPLQVSSLRLKSVQIPLD